MGTLVSSTPSRRGWLIAGTASLIVAAALAAWLVPQRPDDTGARKGHALGAGLLEQADLEYDQLRSGKEYWLNLPQATNASGEPVTITKAQFVNLPKGLELIGYKVVSVYDTGGYGIGVRLVKSPSDDITGLPERSSTFTVKAHKPANSFHMVWFRVTGPVTGDTSQCRFWYRQGSVKYRQDLRCVNQLRLAKK
ncbi:hypothetical protein OG568_50610 (plasmid) [Streptomyces sp. NBC_01450]|uniref:hypothetical protein n=1 Tax=Streptomyces sp. NBC_01450 TaxID=2903871 RepID=UPI002E368DC5|nr:hypothetical protein [Streptomyces sp. NBC_01450]